MTQTRDRATRQRLLPQPRAERRLVRSGRRAGRRRLYLTASSFGRVPGLPLLHSRDLVNWTLVGHALERLEPAHAFATPRHDRGVWAPVAAAPRRPLLDLLGRPRPGISQVNAEEIRGPWTARLVKAGKGLIDACPLWDDETGEAYLVHAWAKSRSGIKNRLTGHRMQPRRHRGAGRGRGDRRRRPHPRLVHPGGPQALPARRLVLDLGARGGSRPAGRAPSARAASSGRTRSGSSSNRGHRRQRPPPGRLGAHGVRRGLVPALPAARRVRAGGAPPAHGGLGRDGWPVIGDDGAPVTDTASPDLPPQPPVARRPPSDDFPGVVTAASGSGRPTPGTAGPPSTRGTGCGSACVRTATRTTCAPAERADAAAARPSPA